MSLKKGTTLLVTDGKPGAQGESAYRVAVANGFKGTESEWLASLKGADGIIGKDGKSAYTIATEGGFTGTEQQLGKALSDADKYTISPDIREVRFLTQNEFYNLPEKDDRVLYYITDDAEPAIGDSIKSTEIDQMLTMTAAEYGQIEKPDERTLYYITDDAIPDGMITQKDVEELLAEGLANIRAEVGTHEEIVNDVLAAMPRAEEGAF